MQHLVSFVTLSIIDDVNDFLKTIIDNVVFYLENIEPWAASLVLLAIAILTLVGFFVLLKKFIKTFIVLGVLSGAFYVIYEYTDILDSILKIII